MRVYECLVEQEYINKIQYFQLKKEGHERIIERILTNKKYESDLTVTKLLENYQQEYETILKQWETEKKNMFNKYAAELSNIYDSWNLDFNTKKLSVMIKENI